MDHNLVDIPWLPETFGGARMTLVSQYFPIRLVSKLGEKDE